MLEELRLLLRELAENGHGIEEGTREFLSKADNVEAFAKKIEDGESKDSFLLLPGMVEGIYRDLRKKLNRVSVGGQKTLVANRGRRGGLSLVEPVVVSNPQVNEFEAKSVAEASEKADEKELTLEKEYYPLVKRWGVEAGFLNTVVTGGKLPGYKWENPDLISLDFTVPKYSKSIHFEIVSFEVKLNVTPYAVWQAAHYKRFSNQVYVAFAKNGDEIREQNDGRVFELAVEFGLGVLAYQNGSFAEIQSPRREVPEATRIDEMIERFQYLDDVKELTDKAIIAKHS